MNRPLRKETKLFRSTTIGKLKLRNRFVRSATFDGMAKKDGRVSDDQIALYTRLARGGVGLVVTGMASVHPSGQISGYQNTVHDDRCIAGLQRLAAAVHRRGAKVALQLAHAGREAFKYLAHKHATALAPSVVPDAPCGEAACRAMTDEEIEDIVRAFGDGARRAREAKFDAVQIHGAHAYLFSQFLSPFSNRRNDRWGGSLENRMRFLSAVYRAVRTAVGADFPVMIKLGVADGFPHGLQFEEGCRAAVECAGWGFDALEISQGLRGEHYSQTEFRTAIDRPEREAYFRDWCREVKARVAVPVMMVGGLRRLEQMEAFLRDGEADFMALCRPLIREPGLIERWAGGELKEPDCISCNACFNALLELQPLACAIRVRSERKPS